MDSEKKEKTTDVSRYVSTDIWDFTIEVITPAFLGGADSNAELRSASFKGLLRYWWRVLYGARYGNNILQRESEIFGTTTGDKKNQIGKSNVQITVEPIKESIDPVKSLNGKSRQVTSNGENVLEYLAYGVAVISRTAIQIGTQFNLKLIVNKKYSEEVIQAFLFLCNYGGIGSKSRNGFGTLKIIKSEPFVSISKDKLFIASQKQPYSALSLQSKIFYTKGTFVTWEEALSELANIYIDVRKSIDRPHTFINRGLLARPIIAKFENISSPIKNSRHPKFIIMSVSKTEEGKHRGVILTLPIKFYEQENEKQYTEMQNQVHSILAKRMEDKTMLLIGGGSK